MADFNSSEHISVLTTTIPPSPSPSYSKNPTLPSGNKSYNPLGTPPISESSTIRGKTNLVVGLLGGLVLILVMFFVTLTVYKRRKARFIILSDKANPNPGGIALDPTNDIHLPPSNLTLPRPFPLAHYRNSDRDSDSDSPAESPSGLKYFSSYWHPPQYSPSTYAYDDRASALPDLEKGGGRRLDSMAYSERPSSSSPSPSPSTSSPSRTRSRQSRLILGLSLLRQEPPPPAYGFRPT